MFPRQRVGISIGNDIAVQLAKSGAKVVGIARTKDLLDKLKSENPSIETIEHDITDWKKTEQVITKLGPVDLLVNSAGLGWVKPMTEMVEKDYDELRLFIFTLNTKALINITRLVVKDLLCRKAPGAIVNLSSQASLAGLLNHTVYCASKAAVDGFTRAVALEYGPYNIRINTVNPTVIMTDMGRMAWSDPKVGGPMLDKIPLKRFGEVRDVTDAVLYLLSDKAAMITGHCLPIDGGFISS
ncbi:hypothetical protein NQ315_001578 [Exocentrus adspersus]|uniref:L-xylulose reductase n=1 Tax=Exocentrus adspersus TaxID=1586481 RepID=A0AAV8WAD9_9CUCU|nr:hypothetical protein NQ315_001578 [Exocentrus adspersus]